MQTIGSNNKALMGAATKVGFQKKEELLISARIYTIDFKFKIYNFSILKQVCLI